MRLAVRDWEREGMGITNGNEKGIGIKTRLNLGSGMGMNHWEWEGMRLKKTSPLILNRELNRLNGYRNSVELFNDVIIRCGRKEFISWAVSSIPSLPFLFPNGIDWENDICSCQTHPWAPNTQKCVSV